MSDITENEQRQSLEKARMKSKQRNRESVQKHRYDLQGSSSLEKRQVFTTCPHTHVMVWLVHDVFEFHYLCLTRSSSE